MEVATLNREPRVATVAQNTHSLSSSPPLAPTKRQPLGHIQTKTTENVFTQSHIPYSNVTLTWILSTVLPTVIPNNNYIV